jgi:Flp pilus assembly protein TadD
VCAALLVLVAAGAAEIPLRTGLVDLASADASSADAAFGLAHGLRPWDADLDAQIAHALVSSPRPAGVVDPVDTYLDRAASALPQDPAVLADRGLLEARRGHAAVSRELLDRAHQLAPHDPVVLLLRGQVRSRSADLSGAIADLEASASLSPRNRLPLDVLAGLYAQAGRSELAAATLARAQALGR